jgi:hypothetical protein
MEVIEGMPIRGISNTDKADMKLTVTGYLGYYQKW